MTSSDALDAIMGAGLGIDGGDALCNGPRHWLLPGLSCERKVV